MIAIKILMPTSALAAMALPACGESPWKAKELPPAIARQWIALVRDHKTSDGATVLQVLAYGQKLRPARFRFGGFDIVYDGNSGEPDGVSVEYFIGAKRLKGDAFSVIFTIEKDHGVDRIVFNSSPATGSLTPAQTIEAGRGSFIRFIDDEYEGICVDPQSRRKLC